MLPSDVLVQEGRGTGTAMPGESQLLPILRFPSALPWKALPKPPPGLLSVSSALVPSLRDPRDPCEQQWWEAEARAWGGCRWNLLPQPPCLTHTMFLLRLRGSG